MQPLSNLGPCCRKLLERKLKERGPRFLLHSYPDVLYGHYGRPAQESCGDVFYFDYGCVAFWGLTQKQEQDILRNLVVPCEDNPLPPAEVEIDEFQVGTLSWPQVQQRCQSVATRHYDKLRG